MNVWGNGGNSGVVVLDLNVTGNLTFTTQNQRIWADLTSLPPSLRLLFQTTVVNGLSDLGIIPNGTGNQGGFTAYNASNPDVASQAYMRAIGVSGFFGASQQLILQTANTNRLVVDGTGLISISNFLTLHANPVNPLHAATKQYTDALVVGNYVLRTGDSMSGFLTLNANPVNPLHAAPKQYVDSSVLAGPFVFRAGDTMTGFLTLSAAPVNPLHAATKGYTDNLVSTSLGAYLPLAGGNLSGNLGFSGAGRRIVGDFSNATLASRLAFQSSVVNGNTNVGALPNGTAQSARFAAYNSSSAVDASVIEIIALAAETRLQSNVLGAGVLLPLVFSVGIERMRIETTGEVMLAVDPTLPLQAATKQYVDAVVTGGGLPTTGGIMTGNIQFNGNGRRITGDLTSAPHPNRLLFQTTVLNGISSLGVIPNGTAKFTQFTNWTGVTANENYLSMSLDNVGASINTGVIGAAVPVPLSFHTNNAERFRLSATENRFQAKFGGAPVGDRFMLQNNIVNDQTSIGVIPNGTNKNANFTAWNSSTPNDSAYFSAGVNATEVYIDSNFIGASAILPLTFKVGFSEKMRIDANGIVTVGTGAGVPQIIVNGGNAVNGGSNLVFKSAGANTLAMGNYSSIIGGAYDAAALIYAYNSLLMFAGGAERMRITATGEVGIGLTPASNVMLHILRNAAAEVRGVIQNQTASGNAVWTATSDTVETRLGSNGSGIGSLGFVGTQTNSPFIFLVAGAERMRIEAGGNIGIGTVAPANLGVNTKSVHLFGSTGAALRVSCNSVAGDIFAEEATLSVLVRALTNHPLRFITNNLERMRIDGGGVIRINTTAAIGGDAAQLQLKHGGFLNGMFMQSTDNISSHFYFYNAATVQTGSITATATNVAYNTGPSDYRLKKNIAAIVNSGELIDALNPVTFTFDLPGVDATEVKASFLAHELQVVFPEAVTGKKDEVDKDGKPVYQQISPATPGMMATIVAELKSLRARVAYLENNTIH